MRRDRARFSLLAAGGAVTALTLAACGSGNASTTSSTSNAAKPITVGISLPLSGSFSADGIATEHGYQLWASDVNSNGGLLGRPVRLKILDDKSDPKKTTVDYNTLIGQDHVDLTLAPYSTLLSYNAAQVTASTITRWPMGPVVPLVFTLNDPYLFSVSPPVANQMVPFANWVLSLPPGQRPTTAAYPMVSDPFADPPVQTASRRCATRYQDGLLHAQPGHRQRDRLEPDLHRERGGGQAPAAGGARHGGRAEPAHLRPRVRGRLHAEDHDRVVRPGPG